MHATGRQGHKLAVKLQGGKRTGKAARKEIRATNRAAAASERTAVASEAPQEEVRTTQLHVYLCIHVFECMQVSFYMHVC